MEKFDKRSGNKGRPLKYNEKKSRKMFLLTATATNWLNGLSKRPGIASRNDVLEKLARLPEAQQTQILEMIDQ